MRHQSTRLTSFVLISPDSRIRHDHIPVWNWRFIREVNSSGLIPLWKSFIVCFPPFVVIIVVPISLSNHLHLRLHGSLYPIHVYYLKLSTPSVGSYLLCFSSLSQIPGGPLSESIIRCPASGSIQFKSLSSDRYRHSLISCNDSSHQLFLLYIHLNNGSSSCHRSL